MGVKASPQLAEYASRHPTSGYYGAHVIVGSRWASANSEICAASPASIRSGSTKTASRLSFVISGNATQLQMLHMPSTASCFSLNQVSSTPSAWLLKLAQVGQSKKYRDPTRPFCRLVIRLS